MSIAILSDTHDNVRAIDYFIEYFNHAEADVLLHAGDFISPFTIPRLAQFRGPVVGVFGNNDGDRETLRKKSEDARIDLHEAPHEFTVKNTRCLMAHRPVDLPDDIPSDVDLVIHGHTHERKIERTESHTIINPGEAGGWITRCSQAVLYHPETKEVSVEMVPAP